MENKIEQKTATEDSQAEAYSEGKSINRAQRNDG